MWNRQAAELWALDSAEVVGELEQEGAAGCPDARDAGGGAEHGDRAAETEPSRR
ncbi:MAG TPA: hypothetical protein VGN22_09785 [Pseudonocardia sp.]